MVCLISNIFWTAVTQKVLCMVGHNSCKSYAVNAGIAAEFGSIKLKQQYVHRSAAAAAARGAAPPLPPVAAAATADGHKPPLPTVPPGHQALSE